jgi:hypothetical protein
MKYLSIMKSTLLSGSMFTSGPFFSAFEGMREGSGIPDRAIPFQNISSRRNGEAAMRRMQRLSGP